MSACDRHHAEALLQPLRPEERRRRAPRAGSPFSAVTQASERTVCAFADGARDDDDDDGNVDGERDGGGDAESGNCNGRDIMRGLRLR